MEPFLVAPELRARIWGGGRLGRVGEEPVGEAWYTGPAATAASGEVAGQRLDDLVHAFGTQLVGTAAPGPDAFPLLVKLLDPADWLSVQVHPDDATALALEGPGAVGKEEAWYCLEAVPGAELLLGVKAGVALGGLQDAIRRVAVSPLLQRHHVSRGDAFLVQAGALHAVGPGVLLYEVQQPSDITYRVDDWGRPATAGRALHTRQALTCARAGPAARRLSLAEPHCGRDALVIGEHFVLDVLDLEGAATVELHAVGASPHVLTAASGSAALVGPGWALSMAPLETVVVPATAGRYGVMADGSEAARVLLAQLPVGRPTGPTAAPRGRS